MKSIEQKLRKEIEILKNEINLKDDKIYYLESELKKADNHFNISVPQEERFQDSITYYKKYQPIRGLNILQIETLYDLVVKYGYIDNDPRFKYLFEPNDLKVNLTISINADGVVDGGREYIYFSEREHLFNLYYLDNYNRHTLLYLNRIDWKGSRINFLRIIEKLQYKEEKGKKVRFLISSNKHFQTIANYLSFKGKISPAKSLSKQIKQDGSSDPNITTLINEFLTLALG